MGKGLKLRCQVRTNNTADSLGFIKNLQIYITSTRPHVAAIYRALMNGRLINSQDSGDKNFPTPHSKPTFQTADLPMDSI